MSVEACGAPENIISFTRVSVIVRRTVTRSRIGVELLVVQQY